MPAPAEIIDALESVIDIYLSDVRHRERAAFILCDNLVEMACKTKAKQHNYRVNLQCGFHDAIQLPGFTLSQDLKDAVMGYRDTRNNMQHGSAAVTVGPEHCAGAILHSVDVIESCWPGTTATALNPWVICALRVVRLLSSRGDAQHRSDFERFMRDAPWRVAERETVRRNAKQLEIGIRNHWNHAVRYHPNIVQQCLNQAKVPP